MPAATVGRGAASFDADAQVNLPGDCRPVMANNVAVRVAVVPADDGDGRDTFGVSSEP
jgi:hypothetical protein